MLKKQRQGPPCSCKPERMGRGRPRRCSALLRLVREAVHLGNHIILLLLLVAQKLDVQETLELVVKQAEEGRAHVAQETLDGVEAQEDEGCASSVCHEFIDTDNLAVAVVVSMGVFIDLEDDEAIFEDIYKVGSLAAEATGNDLVVVGVPLETRVGVEDVLDHALELLDTFGSRAAGPALEAGAPHAEEFACYAPLSSSVLYAAISG